MSLGDVASCAFIVQYYRTFVTTTSSFLCVMSLCEGVISLSMQNLPQFFFLHTWLANRCIIVKPSHLSLAKILRAIWTIVLVPCCQLTDSTLVCKVLLSLAFVFTATQHNTVINLQCVVKELLRNTVTCTCSAISVISSLYISLVLNAVCCESQSQISQIGYFYLF